MDITPSMGAGEKAKPDGDAIGGYEATEDIAAGQPVVLNADDTVSIAGDGDFVFGSAKQDMAAGESETVHTHGLIVYQVDAAVAAGDPLEATPNGDLAPHPGDGSGTENRLRAVTDANDDGLAGVLRI